MPRHIISKCDGCFLVDFRQGICTAFIEPAYQWQDGKTCWGRCDSVGGMICRLEDIIAYAAGRGQVVKRAETEIEEWMALLKYEECV